MFNLYRYNPVVYKNCSINMDVVTDSTTAIAITRMVEITGVTALLLTHYEFYILYKLTDGEIEIVEEAITDQVASCGRDYCANSGQSVALQTRRGIFRFRSHGVRYQSLM